MNTRLLAGLALAVALPVIPASAQAADSLRAVIARQQVVIARLTHALSARSDTIQRQQSELRALRSQQNDVEITATGGGQDAVPAETPRPCIRAGACPPKPPQNR